MLKSGGKKMNREITQKEIVSGKILKLIEGDLTEEKVDAIVNAANSHLQHGGGVAGAIVRKGGPTIQKESNEIGYVGVGEAAITTAGKLPAKFVIHAVGPRWGEGDEDGKLESAVRNSLKLAEENNLSTISLPAISAGIFGFPMDRCADIMLNTIREFLKNHPKGSLSEVRICLLGSQAVEIFEKHAGEIFK